jgi:hypothetical protein
MKALLIAGTIAALALSTTAQAKSHKHEKAARQVVTTQRINNPRVRTVDTRSARTVVTSPARTVVTRPARTVVTRNYNNGGRYYTNGYYGGGYGGYYNSGPSFSIGIGGGYPWGYGLGYPGYGYGYNNYGYPYGYGYNSYPYGYNTYGYHNGGNVVAEVQQRLAQFGYYHGAIDGVAGPRTRAAVARWEARHGMYADGRIHRDVLRSLGLG